MGDRIARLLAGFGSAPIGLRSLAPLLNAVVRHRDLSRRGRLVRGANGINYVLVERSLCLAQRRFVIAHEFTHIVLTSVASELPAECSCLSGAGIERLCNKWAARILVPTPLLYETIQRNGDPDSLALGLMVAERFGTSLLVALRRISEEAGHLVIMGFRYASRPGSTEKLRLMWSFKPKGVTAFLPTYKPPAGESNIILQAFREKRRLSAWQDLSEFNLGNSKHLTSAMPYAGGVLAVASIRSRQPKHTQSRRRAMVAVDCLVTGPEKKAPVSLEMPRSSTPHCGSGLASASVGAEQLVLELESNCSLMRHLRAVRTQSQDLEVCNSVGDVAHS